MRQNANSSNSHNESSPSGPEIQQAIQESKIAAALFKQHVKELRSRIINFEPQQLCLDKEQSAALVACLLEIHDAYGLAYTASELEDVVSFLLAELGSDGKIFIDPGQLTNQVDKLLYVAKTLRFIDQHIIPYTQP